MNGNAGSNIEEHKAIIGFVPQEDIVYPDLTVRENLLYSGRLQLPAGTSEEEIADLADATMAALGLSRIAKSLVGDAKRRGVSGGEKKRVNIGLELMKKPKILFLDEVSCSGCFSERRLLFFSRSLLPGLFSPHLD